ncbi:hypothetical protein [Nocardiopsis listeri]|uniref:hypothetical protein n=1 Tax=Nocardiopsis listeri TaxID=53440 RepID=UPI00082DA6AD|nr:hypothetical protein [Nocardiopsis listeri]
MAAATPGRTDPMFDPPHPYGYVYVGASVSPPERGPLVRGDRRREEVLAEFAGLLPEVEARPEVVATSLYEAVFMPPLSGAPRYDVVVLITTVSTTAAVDFLDSEAYRELGAELVMVAGNTRRIGETEDGSEATFLFNHFTAPDPERAVVAWEDLAHWYVTVIGVDNSTLLRPRGDAAFAMVNQVRLPGGPLRFLLAQFVRPSFFRRVRGGLRAEGMRAMPVFYRRV